MENSKKYSEHKVYKCDLCKLQAVFDSEETVERHLEMCLMNEDNKFPSTSKHFRIKVYPFTKKYKKVWLNDKTHFQYGMYARPYSVLLDRELDEEELYQEDENWEKRDSDTPLVILTDEYKEFIKLLDEQDDVEVSQEVKDFVELMLKDKTIQ